MRNAIWSHFSPISFFALIFTVGGVLSSIANEWPTFKLDVHFPTHVVLSAMPMAKPQGAEISVKLTNASKATQNLSSNGCKHTYDVLDANTKAVVQAFPESCTMEMNFLPLISGGSTQDKHRVQLDPKNFTNGGKYLLQYAFWGVKQQIPFSVSLTQ